MLLLALPLFLALSWATEHVIDQSQSNYGDIHKVAKYFKDHHPHVDMSTGINTGIPEDVNTLIFIIIDVHFLFSL